ncbi:hypothetical protein KFE25_013012 [Diacronema lutheri]|uniref:alpha-1,2-Mannosidase n=1 Tax=Diacronema lutheri TaxID=2081491 RepID=A0A8J5X6E7_DIALT|nr:hypothetical protein KFE25_013012 [Diacronema lutheri]
MVGRVGVRPPALCALLVALLAGAQPMSDLEIEQNRDAVATMFSDAFSGYMKAAFPHDELRPISGGWTDSLIELGNVPSPRRDGYSGVALTLLDSMDTLAVLGNHSEFAEAVRWVGEHVSFDQDAIVSVFETTIRALGGLLSAHVLAAGAMPGFAHMRVGGYDGALLRLARDLGDRLLPAFEQAPRATGLPWPFVHLQRGLCEQPVAEQCTAGVGTSILEFALLSNLTADERYARASLGALGRLWARRSAHDLLGTTLNIHTGAWINPLASIGAGVDSFFEYLAKGARLLDSSELHAMFDSAYAAVGAHLQTGPHFAVADMNDPASRRQPAHGALQAFWPGLQCLVGDARDAARTHEVHMQAFDKYGAMPENYSVRAGRGEGRVFAGHEPYPLRPEVAESTLALYRATGDHAYLRFGARMIASLNRVAKAPFGYASVRSVATGALEDHMPSFFLAETLKYLFLLFDLRNPLHAQAGVLLSTEAHLFPTLGASGLPHDVWLALGVGKGREASSGELRQC